MIVHSFDYPPLHGGISRLCAEIAAGLSARGLPVLGLSQQGGEGAGSTIPDVSEVRVTSRRPLREWQAFRSLRSHRGRGKPVVCGTWYPEGLLAVLAGVRPVVILAHGSELMPPRERWRRPIWRRLQRRVLEAADLVLADSDYTRRLVLDGSPGCRVATVPLAVDHVRFHPGDRAAARSKLGVEGRLTISSVSRINFYKGHEVVFRALAALPPDARGRFTYLVAGRGPDEGRLRELSAGLGLDGVVRWLGYVAEDDLPDVYRASDLFALCTREVHEAQEVEGFGLVFLEAQACGTPVVGTRTGGIPDAVHEGRGGWLIEQDDHDALARLLKTLADDPQEFRRAGIEARRRVEEEATWDHYVRRLEAALERGGLSLG